MASKLQQLEEQLAALKNKVSQERRRADTRRKVLLGVALEAAHVDGKVDDDFISQLLNRYITKKSDREFLGLALELEPQSSKNKETKT